MTTSYNTELVIGGDSAGAEAAIKRVQLYLDPLARSFKQVQIDGVKSGTDTAAAYDKLRKSIDPLYARSKRYEAAVQQLNAALKSGAITQTQYTTDLEKAAMTMGLVEHQTENYNRVVRTSRFHTANLAAQFNDIGVMMASGQSPFILAVQQGTQISQVLGSMGGTAKQQFGALAAGLRTMVSPMSLLTIGIIAGAAALVQWGISAFSAEEKTKTFDDALGELKTSITDIEGVITKLNSPFYELIEQFGTGAAKVQGLYADMLKLSELEAMQNLSTAVSSLNSEFEGLTTRMERLLNIRAQGFEGDVVWERQVRKLNEEFGLTVEQGELIYAAFEKLRNASGVRDQQEAAQSLFEALERAYGSVEAIPPEMLKAARATLETAIHAASLEKKMVDAKTATDNLVEVSFGPDWLNTAITQAATLATTLWDAVAAKAAAEGGAFVDERGAPTSIRPGSRGRKAPPRPSMDADLGPEDKKTGGGRSEDSFERELERLQESLMTQTELEIANHLERQEILQQALDQRLITQAEYQEAMEELNRQHNDRLAEMDVYRYGSTLQQAEAFFGDMAAAMAGGNDKMQRLARAFGAIEALINAWRAYAQVIADPSLPWFAKLPKALAVLAAGMGAVNAIKGGGGGGGGRSAPGGGGGGTTAPAAARATPLQATLNLQGPFANALSGALGPLLDGLNQEAGDRGYQLLVRA